MRINNVKDKMTYFFSLEDTVRWLARLTRLVGQGVIELIYDKKYFSLIKLIFI